MGISLGRRSIVRRIGMETSLMSDWLLIIIAERAIYSNNW